MITALLGILILTSVNTGCDMHAETSSPTLSSYLPGESRGHVVSPLLTTRQEIQDIIYSYHQKTLQELPDGYLLDETRFPGNSVVPCDDNDQTQTGPANFSDTRDLVTPPGTDHNALIAHVGEIWRGWGWHVEERQGFDKPNRFAISPEGYLLAIKTAGSYNPLVVSESPCFRGDAQRYIPVPSADIITKQGPQFDPPSTSPTR